MTQITLHQGYFGEVDKAHSCIASDFDHSELNNFLKTFTDRPIEMPAGVVLNTYFSGVAKHGYYVFTKTFPDTSSSRGGMVFTHALLIRQEDLSQINRLQPLFGYFVDEIPESRQLKETPITIEPTDWSPSHTQPPAYVQKTLEAMTNQKLPAVFCGNMATFIDTLSTIWAGLSRRLRQKFQFGIRFTPDSIKDETSLTLAYVPEDMREQWVNHSAIIISSQNTQKVEITSLAQQLLLGAHQNNPLKAFIDELAIELDTFQIYHKCENVYSNYENLGALSALQTTRLLRQVIAFSPKPENGQSIKSKILAQIAQLIKDGQHPQIQSLRNIDLQMVNNGVEILSQAIKHYINALFTGKLNFEKESVLKWVKFIKEDSSQQWWVDVVSVAIRDNIVTASDAPTQNTWQLIQGASEQAVLLTTLSEYIPTHHSQEQIFIKHLPKLRQNIVTELVPIIAQRSWYLLHAHCLLQHQQPSEALLAQLELEKSLSIKDSIGVKWIENKLTDNELLALAITNGEQKLMEYAVQRIIKNPALLTNLDVLNSHWLKLWALVLHQTKNLILGIDNLPAKAHQIYDQVAASVQIPEIILDLLSDSPQADLTNYPQQSQLLTQLPLPLKQKFTEATIEAYLDALIKGRTIEGSLDSTIRQKLTSDSYIAKALSGYKNDMDKIITVYDHFGLLSDDFLSNYIQNLYAVTLPVFQSNYLGKAISDRGYTKSARRIFDKAKVNDTFKPAFEQCKHLITRNFWDNLFYGSWFGFQYHQYAPTKQEAYKELVNLATQLYPHGPEQNNIWEEAGGDIAKLKNQNSRQENWQEAIRLLQNGGGGKDITVSSLLEAMSSEYSKNDKLKALIQFFKS